MQIAIRQADDAWQVVAVDESGAVEPIASYPDRADAVEHALRECNRTGADLVSLEPVATTHDES
ncbi:hypothetical protein [Aquisphaera insulae]|uniref:hypothetical protein n=1 Tax=Aquisphaera insulae TaxID=2712864 RepID=UPI0013ECD750|nr:hypothetical protein [Aquisphaera insulae]